MQKIIFLILLLIIIGNEVTAKDPKDLTDQELDKMSQEEIGKLPAKEMFAKIFTADLKKENRQVSPADMDRAYYFMLEQPLRDLGFYNKIPTGENSPELNLSVKEFQKSLNKEPTGTLSMGEFGVLTAHWNKINPPKIFAGNVFNVYGGNNYISAKGSWVNEDKSDENQEFAINTTEIVCNKKEGSCKETYAYITASTDTDEKSWLNIMTYDYTIIKWSNNEVMAELDSLDPTKCRSTTLTINTKAKEVYSIERNNSQKDCDLGLAKLPKLEKPRVSKLVDGLKENNAYYDELQKRRNTLMSPAYQAAMKSLKDIFDVREKILQNNK